MRTRRATEKDINRIGELLDQVDMVHHIGRPDLFNIGRKYTARQLQELLLDDTRPVFVAEDEENRVLGHAFCVFQQHVGDNILTAIKTLYIDDICVDEKARGRGVGRTLYDAVIAFAKESDCYNVTLNVWTCNEGALKFYETMGLKPQKIGMEKILADAPAKESLSEPASFLIAETTKEQRKKIVEESIGNISATCDGCMAGYAEMYQEYIDGVTEIREINRRFSARYIKGMERPSDSEF